MVCAKSLLPILVLLLVFTGCESKQNREQAERLRQENELLKSKMAELERRIDRNTDASASREVPRPQDEGQSGKVKAAPNPANPEPVAVETVARVREIRVFSGRPSTTIRIDGARYGDTPADSSKPLIVNDIVEGEHTVEFSKQHFEKITKVVTLRAGGVNSVEATLIPLKRRAAVFYEGNNDFPIPSPTGGKYVAVSVERPDMRYPNRDAFLTNRKKRSRISGTFEVEPLKPFPLKLKITEEYWDKHGMNHYRYRTSEVTVMVQQNMDS